MGDSTWILDSNHGTVTLHTDVSGPAARLGHRLTIELTAWRAHVDWDGDQPVSASFTIDVNSLQVRSGVGGVSPLSRPEKGIVRSSALKTLEAKKFPTVEFRTDSITASEHGYVLRGPLTVHGVTRTIDLELDVHDDGDEQRFVIDTEVSHRAHKIKQYSLAMGGMRVADPVRVRVEGRYAR